jgi:hypothetical protein
MFVSLLTHSLMRHGVPCQEEAPSLPGWVGSSRMPIMSVLEFFSGLKGRLQDGESLDQNRVANMLLFIAEEFVLIIDCGHSRDASATNLARSSVQIRAMSKFRSICHLKAPSSGGRPSPMSFAFFYAATQPQYWKLWVYLRNTLCTVQVCPASA